LYLRLFAVVENAGGLEAVKVGGHVLNGLEEKKTSDFGFRLESLGSQVAGFGKFWVKREEFGKF